ncbi:hypothetical protein ACA910_001807 [Epithemia clementina (nom. ined.)]
MLFPKMNAVAPRLASQVQWAKFAGQPTQLQQFSLPQGAMRTLSTSSSSVINLSDGDAVKKFTKQKSVVYFTATWCGPCRQIKPIYEELSTKYTGVAFGKVDVDENQDAAADFEIRAVPTFVFFDGKDGQQRFSGADSKQLESWTKELQEK